MEAYPRIHSVFVAQHNIDVMTLHCYILIAMDSFARCENRHHSKGPKPRSVARVSSSIVVTAAASRPDLSARD